ncbi:MAG: glucosyl-3-phosphoglycerate synthase [Pseudonocardiales bacterium]|nr:MAG: glucosyl-3-phosphoglycerate synthase [Pseudonocardiales bacterium]
MRPDARRWYERRTSAAADWPVIALQRAKGTSTVSVVLPALDEEATVGAVVRCVRALADSTGLVDEVVVVDSGSADGTAAAAAAAGARVAYAATVLPALGDRPGKGEVLWKSLAATGGDIVAFLDADLESVQPHYVTGLLGPLLTDPHVALVKGFYERPLAGATEAAGGRVTELVARPLLNLVFPALAGVVQPLSGEYAGRRSLLERLPFVSGYGVETGLLLDTLTLAGLDAIAQVDLGLRRHAHQDHLALGRMAAEIIQVVLARAGSDLALSTALTQFRRGCSGDFEPVTADVVLTERPPIETVPAYADRARAS